MAVCKKCRIDMASPGDDLSRAAVSLATVRTAPDKRCWGCGNKPDATTHEEEREEVPQGLTGQTSEVKSKKKKRKPKKE